MRNGKSARGFTPLDLLSLLVLAALLLTIGLPFLGQVREQSRIQTCVTNLRTIGQATNAYLVEYADLPFALHGGYQAGGQTYTWNIYTEFVWGGGRPDKSLTHWEATPAGGF